MLDIDTVNRMSLDQFVGTFGGIFEHSPWVAERAFGAKPFADAVAMHAAMVAAVQAATSVEKLALLNAHPELAGKEARAKTLTEDSTAEQGSAGLNRLGDEEFARFDALNAAYRKKFGFPFIIAVRGRGKAEILAAFSERLGHAADAELRTALDEVAVIGQLRLGPLFGQELAKSRT